VLGDFDPTTITEILGIEPSSTARRGERVRSAKTVIPAYDRWSRYGEERNTFDGGPFVALGDAAAMAR
jgi:hypothetical protein